jgi:hypothetical protein
MRDTRIESPDTGESKILKTSEPEADYSAKNPSMCDQIIFGIKLFAVFGFFFLMFWLYEKF